jgi:hypothetical protein
MFLLALLRSVRFSASFLNLLISCLFESMPYLLTHKYLLVLVLFE